MCCNSYVPGCAFKSRLIYRIITGGQNECSVRCLPGHAFPDETTESELLCHHGVWDPVEDCDPVCEPACQNGGRCLSDNQCLCGEVTSFKMSTWEDVADIGCFTLEDVADWLFSHGFFSKGLPRRSVPVSSNCVQPEQTRIQRWLQLLRHRQVISILIFFCLFVFCICHHHQPELRILTFS